jgi:nicotinamide phosphoribosyltransferase
MVALTMIDGYKLDHRRQYPEGTQYVYSNWTPRGSRLPEVKKVVFVGLQYFLERYLNEEFGKFFKADVDEVCAAYERRVNAYLGPNSIGSDHIRALHELGYLPLEFKALPEGSLVPLRVPMLTVENTHPDFAWLVNYLETIMSCSLWVPMTSATLAKRMRGLLDDYAEKTGSPKEFVDWQGHDFSFRGMGGYEDAQMSGMGHLTQFTGTDTIPAIEFVEQYYGVPSDDYLVGGSVAATEHSVMCAGGEDDELETYSRLLDLYPAGILSVVSDTWDLWKVLTETVPALHDKIMARDGKLVIRPDSGDPADILCGKPVRDIYVPLDTEFIVVDNRSPEQKGVVELLWDEFGGTITETGHKLLDSHIGVIYGDAINYERAREILSRLEAKGFASANVVFGMGSYGYQYQTRDTFGFAMKATNVVINGVEKPIYKDPVTDNGTKKSLRGRIAVFQEELPTPHLVAVDNLQDRPDLARLASTHNLLTTVWKDGNFVKRYTFDEVRENARK